MYGKKMMGGGMAKMAEGGLTEQKIKRSNPYTGNEKEAMDMEKEAMPAKMADGGMGGKKPAVMAIITKMAKKPVEASGKMGEMAKEEEEGMSEESGMMEAKMAAAEEVMGALKSGDKTAFAGALENFMKACSYED
jgi:hypothetical protein